MKKILCLFVWLAFFPGCRKTDWIATELERNCTGTYLRIMDKNYFVCNPETLAFFEDGDLLETKVQYTSECVLDGAVCLMLFPVDGYLRVRKVRNR